MIKALPDTEKKYKKKHIYQIVSNKLKIILAIGITFACLSTIDLLLFSRNGYFCSCGRANVALLLHPFSSKKSSETHKKHCWCSKLIAVKLGTLCRALAVFPSSIVFQALGGDFNLLIWKSKENTYWHDKPGKAAWIFLIFFFFNFYQLSSSVPHLGTKEAIFWYVNKTNIFLWLF